MASISKLGLVSKALTAASTTSDVQTLNNRDKKFIAYLKASAVNAATTVNCKLQHSPNGTDWYDFATFAAIVGAAGSQAIHESSFATANQGLFPRIRAVVTLAGVTKAATVQVDLWFDPDR